MSARPSRLIAVAIAACWMTLPGAGLLVGEARHVNVKAPSNVLSTSAGNEYNIGYPVSQSP